MSDLDPNPHEARLVAGEPDHRDQFYTAAEHADPGHFTPCCSRSHSPLLVLAHH